MITSSKVGITKKKVLFAPTFVEPQTFQRELKYENWCLAMHIEYNALLNNHTLTLVSSLSYGNIIEYKWVLKLKHKPNGIVQ